MRHVHVLCLVLMLSVALAGCGGAPQAALPPTQPTAQAGATAASNAGEPVAISVFAPQDPEVISDFTTNSFTKEVEQKFNLKLTWQTTTLDGVSAREKRQISLASGDYPDLYLLIPWVDQFQQTELIRYGQQGLALPLNDLIDQHAPHVKAALDKYPYFKAMATAPDGKIYGVPQLNDCYHCSYPNKLWINSKWLKKLGLSAPKTTDEFRAVLEAFKTKDPNGNGAADEVPMSGSIEEFGTRVLPFLMNGFIYDDDRTYLLLNNTKVELAANKPEWKQGLAYIKSLVDAGLIDPGAFTQNAEALKKIGDNASAQLLGASTAMHPGLFTTMIMGAPYMGDYDALPPLQGPHAAYATYNYPSAPGATFVLTNKASPAAQIAAVKLLDYLFTQDGQIRGQFGEEGKDWRKPQAGDLAIEQGAAPLYVTIPRQKGEPVRNTGWASLAQYYSPREFRDGWVQAKDIYTPEGYERRLQEATHLYDGKQPKAVFPHWAVWVDPAVADEAATLRTNITDYVNQNALLFVTGAQDLETGWDAYVAGLDKLNLTRYLEIMQQSYDRSLKR